MDPKDNPNPLDEGNDNSLPPTAADDSNTSEDQPTEELKTVSSEPDDSASVTNDQNQNGDRESDDSEDSASETDGDQSEQSDLSMADDQDNTDSPEDNNTNNQTPDEPADEEDGDSEETHDQANGPISEPKEDISSVDSGAPGSATPPATETVPKPQQRPETQAVTNTISRSGSNLNKKLMLILAGILVLALAAFGLSRLGGEDTPDETPIVKNEIPLLRVSVQDGPLNEFYDNVQNDGSTFVNFQMYEGLVTYDNVNRIVPLLASSWTNPDDQTWLFTLKDDVSFHNGEPMTAEDVKYSIEQRATVSRGNLAPKITAVEVVDPTTVRITTDGPDPLLLSDLALVFIVDEQTAVSDALPAGTGPYVVDSEVEPAAQRVRLTAFNSYHDGQVYTRALDIRQLSNEDAVEAFNNGEIDVASALVSNYEDIDEMIANSTVLTNDFSIAFIGLNGKAGSPLADPKVREAIMLSINPETVIQAQDVNGRVESQFITKEIPGFNPNISRPELNTSRAKELLAEAGFPDGFEIELSYASGSNKGMFDSVKQQLAEIGITVVEDFWGDDAEGFFGKVFSNDLETAFLAYTPDILDASDPYGTLFSADGIITNPVAEDVSDLLEQASQTLDESERLALLQQIGQLLSDNFVSVPLYSRDSVTALSGPFVINRDLPSGITGVKFYKVYVP